MKKLLFLCIFLLIPALALASRGDLPSIPVGSLTITNYQHITDHEEFIIVDARFEKGRLRSGLEAAGAVRIDPEKEESLQKFMETTDKNKPVLIYCT